MNQIEAENLTYPEKPDANGYAKRYYKRTAYYFGAHNSPESFILFGEWKRRLLENGEAVKVKTIRMDLAHQRDLGESAPRQRWHRWPGFVAVNSLVVCLLTLGVVKFVSSNRGALVDGVALTTEEKDFVRGLRTHETRMAELAKTRPARIAELALKLKEEGPNGGKLHQSGNGS